MSKFCGYCGTELPEDTTYCPKCGEQSVVLTEVPVNPNKKRIWIFIGIAIAAALTAAAVITLVIGYPEDEGDGYTTALDHYIAAYQSAGEEKAVKKLAPKAYWEIYLPKQEEKFQYSDGVIYREYLRNFYWLRPFLVENFGNQLHFGYEITDAKDVSGDVLEQVKKDMEEQYGEYFHFTVSEAYDVEIIFQVSGSEGGDSYETVMRIAKIDGEWYLLPGNLFLFDSAIPGFEYVLWPNDVGIDEGFGSYIQPRKVVPYE